PRPTSSRPHHLYFLLLPSSGPHPHLHSFPTRRSSDLYPRLPRNRFWHSKKSTTPRFHPGNKTKGYIPKLRLCPWTWDRHWSLCRDRKSTRLNSSHVTNTYAVFCYKKNTRRRSAPGAGP